MYYAFYSEFIYSCSYTSTNMSADRRSAAIIFTNIFGYTRIMRSDEDKAFDIIAKNHSIH